MAQDVDGILAKIRSGTLPPPTNPPAKCYAGKGSGRTCDACGHVISPDDVEYEVDAGPDKTLVFHSSCHLVWRDTPVGA